MKISKLFLNGSGLLLLAFGLYVLAPSVRSWLSEHLIQTVSAAQEPISSLPCGLFDAQSTANSPRAARLRLDPNESGTRILTYPVSAGQRFEITNARYRIVQVDADFPVAIALGGKCWFAETKKAHCSGIPPGALIEVQDLRPSDTGLSLGSNQIRVTASEPQ